MAGADGNAGPALNQRIQEEARRISFFQLVQSLVRADPESAAPGEVGPPSRERLRFRAADSLAFAPTDVRSLEEVDVPTDPWDSPRTQWLMTVNFLGLYGPASPLPNHFTEEIVQEGQDAAPVRDFLDLFNHRLISFVYRSWARVRHHLVFDSQGPDRFTARTLAFLGLGTDGAREALPLDAIALLRVAGLFSDRRRSAAGLEGILRERLGEIPVRVESCVERSVCFGEEARMQLGRRGSLGQDARVGGSMKDLSGGFRVTLGPLTVAQYRDLLPDRSRLKQIAALIRFYAPDFLLFDVRLRLRRGEAPPLRLSSGADLPLGQMSWIRPAGRDEEEIVLSMRRLDPLGNPGEQPT